MTTAGSIRPFVIKEIRAQLPAWIASALAIAVLSGLRNHEFGLIAYAFGSVTLGSQSIGHEYTDGTLTIVLAQPWSRRRLLLLKLVVLTVMLLALAAFAWLTLLTPGDQAWVLLSLLNGLCVAPLLTMVSRTPIAGVVFTGAAPFWILAIGRYVSGGVLWGVTLTLFAAAAVAEWRLFLRLEAVDGRGPELRVTGFRPASDVRRLPAQARRQPPLWLLVKKELHLQQMTFAVAGVWVVIWAVAFALAPLVPALPEFPLAGVGILYGALVAVLIGSLASAEERQHQTLEWQLLLPMPAWRQWTIKVGTITVLTALLSYALPVALAAGRVGILGWHAATIVLLTTGSLYISSFSRTAVRALIVSGVVMLALGELRLYIAGAYEGRVAFLAVPLAAVVALMLWFGLENHRSSRPSPADVMRQVLWMGGALTLGLWLVTIVSS